MGFCQPVTAKDAPDEGAEHGGHEDKDPADLPYDKEQEQAEALYFANNAFQDTLPAEPEEQPSKKPKLTPTTLLAVAKSALAGLTLSAEPMRNRRRE